MASSYTGLGTELMTTGENAGTWGSTTNTNLQIIEQLSGGYVEKDVTSTPTTLSVSDGSTGAELAHRIIKFTGTISANTTVTVPLDVQQMYILMNGTSGNYTVTFKYVSGSGDTVVFKGTDKGTKLVYATADDGTNPNMVDTGIASHQIHNTLTVGIDDTGYDVKLFGATSGSYALWDESADSLLLTDSTPLKIGDSQDLTLYHDGSNSYITNAIGALKVATETSGIAVTIGHTTSETTIADNLTVTGTLTGTLATAAQGSVTSLGTLTTLTVDNVITNGATIGHTSDTDLMTLADGVLTVAGELDAATLDISGNADIDGTLEADAYTLGGTAFIKLAGTNFTNSLLIGHTTTGTLDAATYNTGVGIATLDALTSGDYNTAVGERAGTAITDGDTNTVVGSNALTSCTTANGNTALGQRALQIVTGSSNIGIGVTSGNNITSGDGNVVIGVADVASATGDNQLKISDGSSGSVVWITGDSSGNLTFPAEVAAATLDISGAIDIDGTSNLDAVDIDGAVQIDGTVTVGVDDTGLDVKFFGASAGAYMEWDESCLLYTSDAADDREV